MPKTYYIHTFGCQMNHSDSERFSTVVEQIGYQPTNEWEKADLIVFNTCSVRQKAEDRVLGMGPQIEQLKNNNSNLKIILTGCMARRTWRGAERTGSPIQMTAESRNEELTTTMPWVDIVLETKDFGKLPTYLGIVPESIDEKPEHYLSFTPQYKNDFQAFVPISTGCDHFCTFCIVPFARGSEVCRSAESIISEVFNLIASGYKDVTLLGQTVNRWVNPKFDLEIKKGMIANTKIPELNTSYLTNADLELWREKFNSFITIGEKIAPDDLIDLSPPRDFLQLLQVLDQIPGQWWTTWVSSHPNYMTDELLQFIGSSTKAAHASNWTQAHQRPYLHFAAQSGSDRILKRMNRRYTRAEFLDRVAAMRKFIPQISLSSDVIVGFPQEQEEDVIETATLMRTAEFDNVFISEFSPRKGTAAGLLKDNVTNEQKAKWKNYLNDDVLAKSATKNNAKLIGTEQLVLIERSKRGYLQARTASNKDTRITNADDPALIGTFTKAKITGASTWSLEAELLNI